MTTHPVDDGPVKVRREITFVPGNVWRVSLVVLGVVALGLILRFVLQDGGSVIFTVLMSWFAAIAMAPIVNRMSRHMRRGVATIIVMLVFVVLAIVFVLAFGSLLVSQLSQLIARIPDLIDSGIAWINSTFHQSLSTNDIVNSISGGSGGIDFAGIAQQVGGNIIGVLGSVLGSFLSLFTFALLTFYFSADGPRLRTWLTRLFPQRAQGVFVNVWDLTAQKTGGYVGARVVLAAINGVLTAIVFFVVGMPFWLPLAMWTGIVAQFVPTIGTYIAIILPVIVGFLSPNPWLGVVALAWGLLYQQVENLTIEPKISARAVDVNPAVAFASVMLGAALFGVAGAFLAVPVMAMLLSLLDIYGKRYELDAHLSTVGAATHEASTVP